MFGGCWTLMQRSIPACAGEPRVALNLAGAGEVYPRVCGGTVHFRHWDQRALGLSPRVRGNLVIGSAPSGWVWSIPACAGEPAPTDRYNNGAQVYPRVCGGTAAARTRRRAV